MQKSTILYLSMLLMQSPISHDPIPKAENLAEMEISYYNAQIELLGKNEVRLNIKIPANEFSRVLELFRGAKKSSAQTWENELVEVGTVFFKNRVSQYYHRICIFKRLDKFESQLFSLDGKMYSIKSDKTLEQEILQIVRSIEK